MPKAKTVKGATKTTRRKPVETGSPTLSKNKQPEVTAAQYTVLGEKVRALSLPRQVFAQTADEQLLAQAVRVYSSNLHQGTKSTKTRGEVTGSTRKIYRQKGTGRARHGDIKAPIFVGGGVAFGPQPYRRQLKLPKKIRRQVLYALLTQKQTQRQISVVSHLKESTGKTRDMVKLLTKLQLLGKRVLVVVTPQMDKARRGLRNIAGVTLTADSSLAPLDVVACEHMVWAVEALDGLRKTSEVNH